MVWYDNVTKAVQVASVSVLIAMVGALVGEDVTGDFEGDADGDTPLVTSAADISVIKKNKKKIKWKK